MKKIYRWLIAAAILFPSLSFGQSVTDNFDDNTLSSSWQATTGYYLFEENQQLRITASKQVWEEFYYQLPSAMDFSANPRVSVKVKSNTDFFLTMALTDEAGTSNRNAFNPLKAKIWGNRGFMDVSFDFTDFLDGTAVDGVTPKKVDATKIKTIILIFNPAYSIAGNVFFDDFKIGSDAGKFPRMEYPMTQTVPMGNSAHAVKLYGITDGTTITATSSNTALIPNPTVSAVSGGVATLTYTPNANQNGVATITTTVSGPGFTNLVIPFDIDVDKNEAPTLDQVPDLFVSAGESFSVKISNIYDGNTESEQTMTVTATSSDDAVIPNSSIAVDYGVNSKTNALITFTPASISSGSKTANITVTVKDNGGTANGGVDTKIMTFKVTVYPKYYKSPTVNAIADNLYAGIGVLQTTQITGINDGNGGTNIASVTATIVSGTTPSVTVNPVVNYTPGSDNATLTYKTSQLGTSKIVVTVTNAGAPANSNGNTSVTDTFTVRGIEVPITGYTENFSASDILGSDYYSTPAVTTQQWVADFNKYPQKWYVEGQGVEQTLTLDPANVKATLDVHKPNTIPRTFAGTWFSPRKLFDLSNNKYLSVKVSATPTTVLAFDLFDVNFKRYGKLIPQRVTKKDSVLTFTFNETPADQGLDFTKIALILINVSNLSNYDGTVTISNLKIGDQADNAPVPPTPLVTMSEIGNRSLFTNSLEQKIDISNIYVVKEGIRQTSPVSISATSSNTNLIPNPTISSISNGKAVLSYSPIAGKTGTSTITVTATGSGATSKTDVFTVTIEDKNTGSAAATVTFDPSTTYQTMIGMGNFLRDVETDVDDLGSTILRIGWSVGTNDLEYTNDNSDPNVLDLSKFKNDPAQIAEVIKAKERGVTKVFATVWSPQYWMKSNLSYNVPFFENGDNHLDPMFYDEFAEWILGCVLKFKEDAGFDLYGVSLQNEPEFPEPYGSAEYTPDQLKQVAVLVAKRFKALGIPTKIVFGEMLPAQNHVLDFFYAVDNDPEASDLIDIFSIHNYDADGIHVGGAGADQWASYYTEAQRMAHKKELWMSETSGFPATTFGAMTIAGNIYNALKYGNINAWTFWDASPETYGMGYYVQKQYYKYIRSGAIRNEVTSSDDKVLSLGFKHPTENTTTILLINSDSVEKHVKVTGIGLPSKMYAYQTSENVNSILIDSVTSADSYLTILPAKSVTTLYSLRVGSVASIDEQTAALDQNIVLFPNPASTEINVALPENGNYNEISVTDLLGRVVKVKTLGSNHATVEKLDLTGLETGMYIVSVKGSKNLKAKILVK